MPAIHPIRTLEVTLPHTRYPIHLGRDLEALIREQMEVQQAEGRPLMVLCDAAAANAQSSYLEGALHGLPRCNLGPGESTKSLEELGRIYALLAEAGMDRSGAIVAFGGGVIGDLAGFAAATYLRGIGLYMIPTTLLAMVDSAVGGKTAINTDAGKNLAGAFHQPEGVWIDTRLLETLPPREFSAGMAEVIKYGLLGDAALFERLESGSRLDPLHPDLPGVIEACCRRKAEIVQDDERELSSAGGRTLLNLGHTFAHAVENVAGYGHYLHGEAVAVGLVLAGRLSVALGWIDEAASARIIPVLERYSLPTALREPLGEDALLHAMFRDKKTRKGRLRMVAMRAIGDAEVVDSVEPELIRSLWRGVGATAT